MSGFFDFEITAIDGSDNVLAGLQGKVVLAVNVASECGLTPHYEGLESLYRDLGPQGFAVVGFPCNQFGAQEPGDEAAIRQFCTSRYDVTFAMSSKLDVNGDDRHPLYAWLTSEENGFSGDIEWNFEKFLIDRDGIILHRYPPKTEPGDKGLLQDIADVLPRS